MKRAQMVRLEKKEHPNLKLSHVMYSACRDEMEKISTEKVALGPIKAMAGVYRGLTGRGVKGGPAIIQARTVRDFLKKKQRGSAIKYVKGLRGITPKLPKPALA